METIIRTIQERIKNRLFEGRGIIIYGARRVGKTTLVKQIQKDYDGKSLYVSCDDFDIRDKLTDITSLQLKNFIGDNKLIIIDEAQRVKNIGITLKILIDNFTDTQVIATGSSSFELSNNIIEPLTGRKYEFYLYPFSLEELKELYSDLDIKREIEDKIIFGLYPEIEQNKARQVEILNELANSYLYKDVLQYQNIKNPEILLKLLQALALQVGNEVSYNELANLIDVDKNTIINYIQILEKAFIIFRLRPFSRNLRNELKKLRKIYFFDTGIRNALINNMNSFNLRQDIGALWENFLISERIKFNNNHGIIKNIYFWRTHQQQEIDYLEEGGGRLDGFEFKWNKNKARTPQIFLDAYSNSKIKIINKDNFFDFVLRQANDIAI